MSRSLHRFRRDAGLETVETIFMLKSSCEHMTVKNCSACHNVQPQFPVVQITSFSLTISPSATPSQYVSSQTHWPSQCTAFTASGGSSLGFESIQHLQLHSSDLTADRLCLQSFLAALINFLSRKILSSPLACSIHVKALPVHHFVIHVASRLNTVILISVY